MGSSKGNKAAKGHALPAAGLDNYPSWLPGKSPQFVATIVVNLIAFSFGSAAGWPSVAQPQLKRLGAGEEALSWAAAIVWPAGLAGAALFGPATERWGRRVAALLVAAPLAAGWAVLALPELWIDIDVTDVARLAPRLADNGTSATAADGEVLEAVAQADVDMTVAVVLLARVLLGVGMGGVLIVCPMYVGEVVEDSLRGQLGSYMVLFVNAGILFVYAVGAQVGFGTLAMCCALAPVAFLALFAWLPETPSYMLSRGDETGALESLLWLRDPRCGDVDGELCALRASLKQAGGQAGLGAAEAGAPDAAAEPATTAGLRGLVATRGARRAMLIVLGLCVLQQFSGITAIVNNASDIFAMAGSSLRPDTAAVVVAVVQMAGSVASVGLADSAGRLPLLYASYGGMASSLAVLGACFCWPGALPGWLPVACLSVFIFVYAMGAGPGPFLLLVEVLPTALRAVGSQAAMTFLFTLAFLIAKFYTALAAALGAAGCFWLFASCCAAGVAFVRVAIPETKGRAVDDIVAELQGGGQARAVPAKTACGVV